MSPTTAALNGASIRAAGALLLGCVLFGWLPRKRLQGCAACVLLLLVAGLATGCGASPGSGSHTTSLISTSYTVTAQFTTASGQSITQPLSLIIQSK